MTPLILALIAVPAPPQDLYRILAKPDPAYSYRVTESDDKGQTISMTSQTWQGKPWQHSILIRNPAKRVADGTGILFITGDGPRAGDYQMLNFVTEATGLPVAMLFDIPNQPIEGMREDDLIAHTFQRYLATGDGDWPLLFPMTKSAIRAMDAVQDVTKSSGNPIRKFVVTGASKRGWTTWFVGASKDPRVAGIAPMVYDNLNVPKQMPHQIQQWGKYSEMIQDYTRRGLQQKLDGPEGKQLATIIDPYFYRENIRVPVLLVNGANDRYWTVDATKHYWNDLKQAKWNRTIPNVGHDLGGGLLAAETIGAFSRSLAGEFKMPKPTWKLSGKSGTEELRIGSDTPFEQARLWEAVSDTGDFRDSKWTAVHTFGENETAIKMPNLPAGKKAAYFVEYRYNIKNRPFRVTSTVWVR